MQKRIEQLRLPPEESSPIKRLKIGATTLKIGANAVARLFFNCVSEDISKEMAVLVSDEY